MIRNIKLVGFVICLVLSILYNPTALQAQATVDLATHFTGTPPAGSVLEWHNASPATAANKLTPAQVAAAPAGSYYAVFYDATNNCYSPETKMAVATNTCPSIVVDLSLHSSAIPPSGSVLEWHSATPVSAVNKLTPAQVSAATAGTYYAVFFDATNNCYSPASTVVVAIKLCTNPDIMVTNTNTPTSGNVNTNDNVPVGTTYGTPTPAPGNPAGGTITMNPDGTYTFISPTPGEYTYIVPVCPPGVTVNCPIEVLTITVLDPYTTNNLPVANTDLASTTTTTPVAINTLSNDAAGNAGGSLNPTSVTVTTAPSNGTASVNPATGAITYTANPGFVGIDTITYQVCDNSTPTPLCASAQQIVTVLPANSTNDAPTAADDYSATIGTTPVTGNALNNDTDPEGNPLTATPQVTNIPGVGTLVLNANGTYTFTAVPGFTGQVDFPYTVCDNGSPSLCSDATIHILVNPETATNPDIMVTNTNTPTSGNVNTNDNVSIGTLYGTPTPVPGNPAGGTITMNPDGTYSFITPTPGEYTYIVPVCPPNLTVNCPTEVLIITVLDPFATNNLPVANTDLASTTTTTPVAINTLSNDDAGNAGGSLNPASVTVTTSPSNGTSSVNPATGAITYTANPGFVGIDTITYQVCDNSTPIPLCASAQQIVTVLPANATNDAPAAADDYNATVGTTPVSGNVLTNDTDPDGNPLMATPQTTAISGVWALLLNADGTYTFTAVPGFNGQIDFPYSACDNGMPALCTDATLHILVNPAPITTPDMNATFVNTTVTGNVNTNDIVPGGTTYGTPFASVLNPIGATLTMNPDGTYSFISINPGVFTYLVPVCPAGQTVGCPTELLTITVTKPNIATNPPTANVDLGITIEQAQVTLNTLANDVCNNLPTCGLDPSSVAIIDAPNHGIATVNPINGNITYQANPGFIGTDTLMYHVCDTSTNPDLCAAAYQIFTVLASGGGNRIGLNDDYRYVSNDVNAVGNVLDNDQDPESNLLSVTPQSVTLAQGTFNLLADGSYLFDPMPGFIGTVNFPYEACDNGVPAACGSATLYITVGPQNPVPLIWGDFVLTQKNCNVDLKWITNNEKNVSHFNVFRQFDGESNFTKVNSLSANNNNSIENEYRYTDVLSKNGTYLYFVQSVDVDGSILQSEIKTVFVHCNDNPMIQIWPNPMSDKVKVGIQTNSETTYQIKLVDLTGRIIEQQEYTTQIGNNIINFNTKSLANGIYQIVMVSELGVSSYKIEKL